MPSRWYYKVGDEIAGPVDFADLKGAVKTGAIRPSSRIRLGEKGAWGPASMVSGLFPTATPVRAASESQEFVEFEPAEPGWYYQLMGQEFGPVSMSELRAKVATGDIDRDTLVRAGEDGDWVLADGLPRLFVQAEHVAADRVTAVPPVPTKVVSPPSQVNPARRPCRNCGTLISRRAVRCPKCGAPQQAETQANGSEHVVCPDCQAPISVDVGTCPECGCPISAPPETAPIAEQPMPLPVRQRPIGISILLGLIGTVLLFYAFSEKDRLDRIDAIEENLARSTNELNRASADFQGGLSGAIARTKPDVVAEKSDRTSVATCFVLGGVFVGLALLGLTVRVG